MSSRVYFEISTLVFASWSIPVDHIDLKCSNDLQSNLAYPNSINRNYWVIRRLRTVPTFFSIIYCNKTTYYSNFEYPKNFIFRSDLSVPIKEMAIKLPFKIRSPNVTHGDYDFFVWSSLFLLYRLIIR